ncbi:MAG: hypothetical protein PVSMB7_15710 [Chloroflexota bacterium]
MYRLRAVVAASPPLLFALLVLKLWLGGTLGYYVNSRTVWIVLVGGVLFAAVGFVAAYRAMRADHEYRLSWRAVAFLVPVLAGLLVPARPLSGTSGQASTLGALQLVSHVSSGVSGDRFGAWLAAIGDHPDASWWAGQHVTLVGFTAGQAGLPKRSFLIGRYLVTCCVVDATLLGFPVQVDRGPIPPQGAWIQVQGVFGTTFWTDQSGGNYPLIQHARIGRVSVPSSPYLSP